MNWKNWPSWLIGGLIGFGIWLFNQIRANLLAGSGIVDNSLIANITQIIIYFVLGAIMGFAISKIKSDKMKTWLRGGLLGVGIWIILFFVEDIRARFVDYYLLSYVLGFPGIQIYTNFIQPNLDIYEDWIIVIPSIIFYFIIGALIGFILGKLKSRRKKRRVK